MRNQDCVTEPELALFVQGDLDAIRLQNIAEHVDNCEPCQDTVVALAENSNTFVETVRAAGAGDVAPQDNALKFGLKRMLASLHNSRTNAKVTENPLGQQTGQVGPYRIEEQLGIGGMGHVYRATHTKLKRTVALKVLPSNRWSNTLAVSRFEREMEAIGGLDHPNIVRASDAGEHEGMHYLVMEFIDGLDLSRVVNRLGPLPVAEACEIARQCAVGLHDAHENGLVHRDVKPSNVMLASGRGRQLTTVKLLDLGLALLGDEHLQAGNEITTVGTLMGTLDYMSPEQGVDSHSVDQRTDIYGLGATLFKLLTGRAPYADPKYSTLMKKMTALATKQAPSIRDVRNDLPEGVVSVVDRMLARDPDERFASADAVVDALAEFSSGADLGKLLLRATATEDPANSTTPRVAVTGFADATATVSKPVEQTHHNNAGNGLGMALIGGLMAMAAGLLFYFQTDYGTLKISSDNDNATVLIKKGEKTVEKLIIENGNGETRLRTGDYQLVVKGGAEVAIEPSQVAIRRGGQQSVGIVSIDSRSMGTLPNSIPEAESYTALLSRAKERNQAAQDLADKGDFQGALQQYNLASTAAPNLDSLVGKARMLAKLGWFDASASAFGQVVQLQGSEGSPPIDQQIFFELSDVYMQSGQYNQALQALSVLLDEHGSSLDAQVWYRLGKAQAAFTNGQQFSTSEDKRKGLEQAREYFHRALQLVPDHAEAKKGHDELVAYFEQQEKEAEQYRQSEADLAEKINPLRNIYKVEDSQAFAKAVDEYFEILNEILPTRMKNSGDYLQASDALNVSCAFALPDAPIEGPYTIQPQGTLHLGAPYGHVKVAGLTIDEARLATIRFLQDYLKRPEVSMSYASFAEDNRKQAANSDASPKVSPYANLFSQTDKTKPKQSDGPVYKKFGYDHWLGILRNDWDPATQGDAVEALGVLGESRSLQTAREILQAARHGAGNSIDSNKVANALGALNPADVVTAVKEEIVEGNSRSRNGLWSTLYMFQPRRQNMSGERLELSREIESCATELAKSRFATPKDPAAELGEKAKFLFMMLAAFQADSKSLADEVAHCFSSQQFPNRRELEFFIRETPDLPGLAEYLASSAWHINFVARYVENFNPNQMRLALPNLVDRLEQIVERDPQTVNAEEARLIAPIVWSIGTLNEDAKAERKTAAVVLRRISEWSRSDADHVHAVVFKAAEEALEKISARSDN